LKTWELAKAGAIVEAFPVAQSPAEAVELAFGLI
jgi:hypothetical protein